MFPEIPQLSLNTDVLFIYVRDEVRVSFPLSFNVFSKLLHATAKTHVIQKVVACVMRSADAHPPSTNWKSIGEWLGIQSCTDL